MSIFEIIVIGIGLSMDAAAVSISNGLANPNMDKKIKQAQPIMFGLFQGLMPVFGFFAGGLFSGFIEKYAGIVTLIILASIGFKMVIDGYKGGDDSEESKLDFKMLLAQSVATSIDAFAVGVSFYAMKANIWAAAPIIAITTFICSLIAMIVGRKAGAILGNRAQVLGGVVLVMIGVNAIL